jgi:hypothetical protein
MKWFWSQALVRTDSILIIYQWVELFRMISQIYSYYHYYSFWLTGHELTIHEKVVCWTATLMLHETILITGTCLIQKIYAPSSSLFQGKHLPFTLSPLRLNILYIWEEMIMMALLHMAGLENSRCIWKVQRKPEVVASVSVTEKYKMRLSLNILVQLITDIWFLKHLFF